MTDAADARIARLEDLVERRLAAITVDSGNWSAPQIKEYIEAILDEKGQALAMADAEREKAASALRGEQQRALDQAERERSKAAENLRLELARAIQEGDVRLAEHITNQIGQIREALASSEKLELARLDGLTAHIDSLSRELEIQRDASERAIAKAEAANEKRFESVNEFRAQLTDQTATFAKREVVEPRITRLESWQSKLVGALALVSIVLPVIVAFTVYLLTRTSAP